MGILAQMLEGQQTEKKPFFNNSLSAWLDRLMRTQYASVATARRLLENRPEEIPQGIWKGLTGQEKGSYRQIAEETNMSSPFWWGLAGDILLDPLTYVPIGKVAKTATSPLKKIPLIDKASKSIYASTPVQKLGRAFSTSFRPSSVPTEQWERFLEIRNLAKNIEQYGTGEAIEFSTKIATDIKQLLKKKIISTDDLDKIISSTELGGLKFGLPDEVKPIIDKLSNYWTKIGEKRKAIGGSLLNDDEYSYFLRQLSKTELEKMQQLGIDIGLRDFTTKTSSDIARKYWKFTSQATGKTFIGKASDFKLLPMSFKGIAVDDIKDMLVSTVKDISDVQDIAAQYGVKIKFTKNPTTLGGNLGVWQELENTARIATGGQSQKDFLSTLAHELAGHQQHGKLGAMAALQSPSVGDTAKVLLPRGHWQKVVNVINNMGEDKIDKFYQKFAEATQDNVELFLKNVSSKKGYYYKPTEVWARWIELWKQDPVLAKDAFSELTPVLKKLMSLSSPLKRYMMRPIGLEDSLIGNSRIFRRTIGRGTNKISTIFTATQPTKMELKAAREAYLAKQSKVFIPEFSSDIPQLTYLGGRRMAKSEAGTKFFNLVTELGSKTPVEGWVKSTAPELTKWYFNPQIAKEIDVVRKTFIGEEVTKDFLKVYDATQNLWKKWTLAVFPAYHFRNMIGNWWNNYLGGVLNPFIYKEAKELQDGFLKGTLSTKDELTYKLAQKWNIVRTGIYGSEIPSLEPTLKKSIGQSVNYPADLGMKVGTYIEDNARLAHFMDKLKKGWSPKEASFSVKKYLFDYQDLTMFEKNVMRRLMPFYTWTRKNLPLQLEALINKTGKVLPIQKIRYNSYLGAGQPPEELLPSWVQERMPMFYKKEGRLSQFPLESYIPFADIGKVVRPTEIASELLSPLIKTPIELASNRSWYFEEAIERYKGETREFLRMDMPVRISYVLGQIRLLNEIHRMIGYKEKSGTELPPQPNMPERLMRLFTGIKSNPLDIQKSIRGKIWDLQIDLKALRVGLNRANKYGRIPEQGRIENQIKTIEDKIKHLSSLKWEH